MKNSAKESQREKQQIPSQRGHPHFSAMWAALAGHQQHYQLMRLVKAPLSAPPSPSAVMMIPSTKFATPTTMMTMSTTTTTTTTTTNNNVSPQPASSAVASSSPPQKRSSIYDLLNWHTNLFKTRDGRETDGVGGLKGVVHVNESGVGVVPVAQTNKRRREGREDGREREAAFCNIYIAFLFYASALIFFKKKNIYLFISHNSRDPPHKRVILFFSFIFS